MARKITKRDAVLRRRARRAKRRARLGVVETNMRTMQRYPSAHFDPAHVGAQRDVLEYALSKKLGDGEYLPHPSMVREIKKPDGGVRRVVELGIPDQAVSLHLLRRMMVEHGAKLSDHAFAYRLDRKDLSARAAIAHIQRALNSHPRLFVVEIDFKDFFDTIDHAYLFGVLRRLGVAEADIDLIQRLVRQPRATDLADFLGDGTIPSVGVGQGSPISLFLANVACWELDTDILRTASAYARFGDDSVVLVRSRAEAEEVEAIFARHCDRSGLTVNQKKSPGIRTFSGASWSGAEPIEHIDFLGRRIFRDGIGLSDRSVERMNTRVSRVIHRHLVSSAMTPLGLSETMRAKLSLRCALTRLLLGGVPMHEVRRVLNGGTIVAQPKGFLAQLAFPDAAANATLRSLDHWLLEEIHTAWRARVGIAAGRGVIVPPLAKNELYTDRNLPSFLLGSKYVRIWAKRHPKSGVEEYELFGEAAADDDPDDEPATGGRNDGRSTE